MTHAMTDETPTAPPTPGERRLAHPPSDRYRAAEDAAAARAAAADGPPRPVSVGRGVTYAVVVGILGAIGITILGGIVTVTSGLVILAAVTGWAVAWALRVGAGPTIAPARRTLAAVLVAFGAVAAGQVGLWSYALSEGGVLPLANYLAEAFGPVVVLQLMVAPLTAWISAR
jgi:hypothetical protein